MRTWPYPAIVAHRGGGKLAPENTLEAIDVGARFGHKIICATFGERLDGAGHGLRHLG